MKVSALLGAVSLAVAGAEAAVHGHGNHGSLARRLSGDMQNFDKRGPNSKWSFYNTETGNAGACGRHIKNSEWVVAMNMAEYNKERHCFKQIILEYGGKTATATIGDACPGCPPNGLDLSTELFRYFASLDKGIIYGSWRFADGGSPPPPPPPPPPPKPTSTWKPPKETWTPPPPPPPPPKPTSTWTPPKETWTPPKETWTPPKETPKETPKPEPTKSEEEKPTTTSSTTATTTPTTTSTTTPTTTPTNRVVANTPSTPKDTPNVAAVNNIAVMMGGLVVGAAYAA